MSRPAYKITPERLVWAVIGVVAGVALLQTLHYSSGLSARRTQSQPPRHPRTYEKLDDEVLKQLLIGREFGWVRRTLHASGIDVGVARRISAPAAEPWDVVAEVIDGRSGPDGRLEKLRVSVRRSEPPPLAISRLREGQECPTEPARRVAKIFDPVLGSGRVVLGGPNRQGVLRVRRTKGTARGFVYLISTPSYSGPLLVRGTRIDERGQVLFHQNALLGSNGLRSFGTRTEMHIPRGRGLRAAGATLSVPGPGCYALQADGDDIHEQIFFTVAWSRPAA